MFQSDTEGNFLFSVGNVRLCPHIQPLASRGNISYLAEIIAKYLTVIKRGDMCVIILEKKDTNFKPKVCFSERCGENVEDGSSLDPLAGWEG